MWKTVAPTIVTGAIRPISVTGTISTGMPASTQSMRFWQESSLYRKLPVAVIVKIDIGRAMRSVEVGRKSCIISTMRGTPCSVKAPETTGCFELVSDQVQAPRVGHLGLDVVVRRERRREVGDVLQAVGEADVLDEVGRVGEADLAGPVVEDLQPGRAGHEVDAVAPEVGVRVAVAVVERERPGGAARSPAPRRPAGTACGRRRRPSAGRARSAGGASRAADLHPDLGEDALRLVEDPADEVVRQDGQAGAHAWFLLDIGREGTATLRPRRRGTA